jgi:Flp pilus assembly protein TadG
MSRLRRYLRQHRKDERERGSAAVEFLLLVPVLLGVTFLMVQWAIHFHAVQIVQTAARQGAVSAASWNGTQASAEATAKDYLASMGGDLQNPQVSVTETATTVTVTVSGDTMEFVPGTHQHVSATLTMPLEEIQ